MELHQRVLKEGRRDTSVEENRPIKVDVKKISIEIEPVIWKYNE
jgi:hypothetical protein